MRAAAVFVIAGFLAGSAGFQSQDGSLRFQKAGNALYFLESGGEASNVAAVVTDEGILLIDTPDERRAPGVLEALRRVSPKPVRWVVNTHFHADHTGGNRYFHSRGVDVIGSRGQRRLMLAVSGNPEKGVADEGLPAGMTNLPRIVFERQMHLFPGGVEVQLLALPHKAHTSADSIVLVPAERTVVTGDVFMPGSFPEIDTTVGDGDAGGWIDALRRTIEFIPLARTAIPAPKSATPVPAEEEKSLEELVVVIPGHGPASNLKDMKQLLEAARRIRGEASRAVSAGRSKESFLGSASLAAYRRYRNLESFAGKLYDSLSKK